VQAVVANMISIFRKMSPHHYDQYIEHFHVQDPAGRSDLVLILSNTFFILSKLFFFCVGKNVKVVLRPVKDSWGLLMELRKTLAKHSN
jgi:hypothetical protein